MHKRQRNLPPSGQGDLADDSPHGSKHVHGDRVIADAVAWHACLEFSLRQSSKQKDTNPNSPPPTSFAARQLAFRKDIATSAAW